MEGNNTAGSTWYVENKENIPPKHSINNSSTCSVPMQRTSPPPLGFALSRNAQMDSHTTGEAANSTIQAAGNDTSMHDDTSPKPVKGTAKLTKWDEIPRTQNARIIDPWALPTTPKPDIGQLIQNLQEILKVQKEAEIQKEATPSKAHPTKGILKQPPHEAETQKEATPSKAHPTKGILKQPPHEAETQKEATPSKAHPTKGILKQPPHEAETQKEATPSKSCSQEGRIHPSPSLSAMTSQRQYPLYKPHSLTHIEEIMKKRQNSLPSFQALNEKKGYDWSTVKFSEKRPPSSSSRSC